MSIWHSLALPEPVRDVDGRQLDVAYTPWMHPQTPGGQAVRIVDLDDWADIPERHLELSATDAARLRDALSAALAQIDEGNRRWP